MDYLSTLTDSELGKEAQEVATPLDHWQDLEVLGEGADLLFCSKLDKKLRDFLSLGLKERMLAASLCRSCAPFFFLYSVSNIYSIRVDFLSKVLTPEGVKRIGQWKKEVYCTEL